MCGYACLIENQYLLRELFTTKKTEAASKGCHVQGKHHLGPRGHPRSIVSSLPKLSGPAFSPLFSANKG